MTDTGSRARLAFAALIFLSVTGLISAKTFAEDFPSAPGIDKATKQANNLCLSCHTETGLKNPPRPDINLKGLANLLLSPTRFAESVHGEEACKDCHGDSYVQFPHTANSRYQIKMCPECHKTAGREKQAQFQETVHFKNHPYNFTCMSCHNPHVLEKPKQLGTAKKLVAQDNGMCRDCHESDYRWGQFTTKPRPDIVAQHAKWLPNPAMHWDSVRCVDCHTPPQDRGTSHLILGQEKAQRDCVVCHSANSSLRTHLYRYFTDTGAVEKAGFLNGAVLTSAYVVGATRNQWLDWFTWSLTGLLVAVLLGHGLLRIVGYRLRKGRK